MERSGKSTRRLDASVRSLPLVVMICQDEAEVVRVAQLTEEVSSVCLLRYRQVADLALNCPRGNVVLVVLIDTQTPAELEKALAWLKRFWSHCSIAIVGGLGETELERIARCAGAMFFADAIDDAEWRALLGHALTIRTGTFVRRE
ncbi:MAG: hypothetical protein HQ546_10890 [Planctomycetes bacterium]|nr:hypothetical protein [Planctomycetota bacterium]